MPKVQFPNIQRNKDISKGRKQDFLQKPVSTTAEELENKDLKWWACQWMEPKLDGIRGCIYQGQLYSYDQMRLYNVDPILESIKHYFPYDEYVFDGELYGSSWEETMSIVRSSKAKKDLGSVTFQVFDLIPMQEFEEGDSITCFWERRKKLTELFTRYHNRKIQSNGRASAKPRIALLHGQIVRSYRQAQEMHASILQCGYEGSMIKDLEASYQFFRDKSWLRWKPVYTEDVKVIGYNPGKGKYEGTLGSLLCIDRKGRKISVSGMTDEERKRIWLHRQQLKGKICEVQFLKRTMKGNLYAAQFKRWRGDKQ